MQAAPATPLEKPSLTHLFFQSQGTRQESPGTPHAHISTQKSCDYLLSTNSWVGSWGLGDNHLEVASFCGRDKWMSNWKTVEGSGRASWRWGCWADR